MYKNIFQKAGLTPTQALILEYLYNKKEDKASTIAKVIKKSRAMVYKDLDEMANLKIIEKIDKPDKISIFRIGHPSHMEEFFDNREKEVKKDREQFLSYLPDMISSYNLINNKPGIRYYEGLVGINKALESITAKLKQDTEIISFTKVLSDKKIESLNQTLEKFVKKRIGKNVKTRVVALDTEEGNELQKNDLSNLRETRIAIHNNLPLDFAGGEILIYQDEIYSITGENDAYFAFVIENKNIAQMLKAFFEVEWSLLSPSNG